VTEPIDSTAEEVGGELVPHEAVAAPTPTTLFRTDDPVEVVKQASRVADALKGVLVEKNLTKRIGNKEHVLVEGWQTLGSMVGVVPVVAWTRELSNGWEARVEARTLDGRVVGAAEAMCTSEEKTWKTRDAYALRSMAQTRATSKALRGPLGFVVTLAGYDATPAEEIPQEDSTGYGQQRQQRTEQPRTGKANREDKNRIYAAASGKLKALELLNLIRAVQDAKPLQLSEQDAMTRLDAALVNLPAAKVGPLLALIEADPA
jgi:hypothetical protein